MRTILLTSVLLALVGVVSCREQGKAQRVQGVVEAPVSAQAQCVVELAELIDPRTLDQLTGKRAATPRLREACYWLEIGRREGEDYEEIIDQAHELIRYPQGNRTREQRRALLGKMEILEGYGCLEAEGLGRLRTGNAPTITKGRYAGEMATVDHTLPRSVVPELDNKLFNLRFMAEGANQRKGNRITEDELEQAEEWHAMGLLGSGGNIEDRQGVISN